MATGRCFILGKPIGRRLFMPIACRQFSIAPKRGVNASENRSYENSSGGGHRIDQAQHTKTALSLDNHDMARKVAKSYLPDFCMTDKVILVTGGGRGLGLTMATALYQAGAIVHCLDRLDQPAPDFHQVQDETPEGLGGELHYHTIDVSETEQLRALVSRIADERSRIDGLIAAAGIQQVTPALGYEPQDVHKMMDINFTGVFMAAQAVAREMIKHDTPGSIVMISSMSAFIANRGLRTAVYNASKAAVSQLARNLAMEWGPKNIRVNALCPGNILTPMVKKNFEDEPHLKELWESNNMLNRISRPEEFRGAGIYLLSDASSFMTGTSLLVDGGYTAW